MRAETITRPDGSRVKMIVADATDVENEPPYRKGQVIFCVIYDYNITDAGYSSNCLYFEVVK